LALAEFDSVYRMAYHLARREDEASDLVQETYLRALSAEAGFELRDCGIRPWLFRILHNVFYSRVSKAAKGPMLSEDLSDQVDSGAAPDGEGEVAWDLASLDWEQVDDRLKHAIAELQPAYREVLLLWAIEGLKYREIADVLGVALGTVMSRLYRARTLLSHQLASLAAERRIKVDDDR
jgi:RNA polymerase sigma-70 factor (ECF subfamily)